MSKLILKIDISSWQVGVRIPWELLWELGVRVVSLKSSMGGGTDYSAEGFALEIRSRVPGMLIELYHWVDPTVSPSFQVNTWFIPQIRKIRPEALAWDNEQPYEWSKTGPSGTMDYSKPIKPATILRAAQDTVKALNASKEPAVLAIPAKRRQQYTGGWFTERVPGLAEWIAEQPAWWAEYFDYGMSMMLDGKPKALPYAIGVDELLALSAEHRFVRTAPAAVKNVIWRQVTSRWVLDGVGSVVAGTGWKKYDAGPLDFNVWLHTETDFYAWADQVMPTQPEPEPEPEPEPGPGLIALPDGWGLREVYEDHERRLRALEVA